jgi:hypothetical protein
LKNSSIELGFAPRSVERRMNVQKTTVRNREIFAACQDGKSIEELAQKYGLNGPTDYQNRGA